MSFPASFNSTVLTRGEIARRIKAYRKTRRYRITRVANGVVTIHRRWPRGRTILLASR